MLLTMVLQKCENKNKDGSALADLTSSSSVLLWAAAVKYVLYTVQPHLLRGASLCYFTALQQLDNQSQNNKTCWISFVWLLSSDFNKAFLLLWSEHTHTVDNCIYVMCLCIARTHIQRGRLREREQELCSHSTAA